MKNGRGIMNYKNGDKYVGEWMLRLFWPDKILFFIKAYISYSNLYILIYDTLISYYLIVMFT